MGGRGRKKGGKGKVREGKGREGREGEGRGRGKGQVLPPPPNLRRLATPLPINPIMHIHVAKLNKPRRSYCDSNTVKLLINAKSQINAGLPNRRRVSGIDAQAVGTQA